MWNTIELAAEFIRRAAFVDANALLKDDRIQETFARAVLRTVQGP